MTVRFLAPFVCIEPRRLTLKRNRSLEPLTTSQQADVFDTEDTSKSVLEMHHPPSDISSHRVGNIRPTGWTDGSVKHHPRLSRVIVDPKTVPESKELQWLEKLGISAWPEGYTLLIRRTRSVDKTRYDHYIYGHPAGKFRSIREFIPHLDFLSDPSEKCSCHLCGRLQAITLLPAAPIQWLSDFGNEDSSIKNSASKIRSLRDRKPVKSKTNVTSSVHPSDQVVQWRWQDGYRPGEIVWVTSRLIDEKRRSWPAQVISRIEFLPTKNDSARTETFSVGGVNEVLTSQSPKTRSGQPGPSFQVDTDTSTAATKKNEDSSHGNKDQTDSPTRLQGSLLPFESIGEKATGLLKGFVQETSLGSQSSSHSSLLKVFGYNNLETFAYYGLRILPLCDCPMPFEESSSSNTPLDILVPSSEIKPFLGHMNIPQASDSVKWHKAVIQAIGLSTTCGPLESTIPERRPGLVPTSSEFCRDVKHIKCLNRFRLGTEEIRLHDLVRLPVLEDRRFEPSGLPQIIRDIHKRYCAGQAPPLYMEVSEIEYQGPKPSIFVTGHLYRQVLVHDTTSQGNFIVAFDPVQNLPNTSALIGTARMDTAASGIIVRSSVAPPDNILKIKMNAMELAGRAYPGFMDSKGDRMPVIECSLKPK